MALPVITNEDIDQILEYATPVAQMMEREEAVAEHPDLQVLLEVLDAFQFTAAFDWQAEFEDKMDELENENIVEAADLEKLRMIMTAHIRIDRMSEGHLEALVRSGYWKRCLDRLATLRTGT